MRWGLRWAVEFYAWVKLILSGIPCKVDTERKGAWASKQLDNQRVRRPPEEPGGRKPRRVQVDFLNGVFLHSSLLHEAPALETARKLLKLRSGDFETTWHLQAFARQGNGRVMEAEEKGGPRSQGRRNFSSIENESMRQGWWATCHKQNLKTKQDRER